LLGNADRVAAVLKDYLTAPISDAEKALFKFVEKVNRQSNTIGPADLAEAKAAGWTDEALYDAISVCALFNFYNRWIDATGVQDMPALAYQMSGHRLATEGYARPEGKGAAEPGK
jgi:alkylhydroperoxidase family enzyme